MYRSYFSFNPSSSRNRLCFQSNGCSEASALEKQRTGQRILARCHQSNASPFGQGVPVCTPPFLRPLYDMPVLTISMCINLLSASTPPTQGTIISVHCLYHLNNASHCFPSQLDPQALLTLEIAGIGCVIPIKILLNSEGVLKRGS